MAQLTPTLPGYRELELIAHGTTSLVFRAVQERLERTVAIKLLLVDQAVTTPEAVARELATMVRLSAQPHIVSIIDTGVTDAGQPYTVMDFCEGGSYAQILSEHGPLHVDDVIEVGIKIGEALHAAHGVGIIHRDVKPSNILRSQFGPALADFGIARAPDELASTLTREMMTPHHASPEALLHQAQSGPSDVYSLASTMWALLVGHPPFVDPRHPPQDLNAFRDRVLHEPLPWLDRDDVPEWLVDELTRAMAKLPMDRHGSAQEFATALRRGALGLPPQAAPAQYPVVRSWPPAEVPVSPYVGPSYEDGLPEGSFMGQPPYLAAAAPPSQGLPPAPSVESIRARVDPTEAAPRASASEFAGRPGSTAGPARPRPVSPAEPSGDLADDGGWLATSAPVPPATDLDDERIRALPRPRFDEVPARRGTLLAVLAGVAVIGLIAAGLLVARGSGAGSTESGPDQAGPTSGATQFVTSRTDGGPTDVRIDDSENRLTLRWRDPTGGGGQVIVLISRNGGLFAPLPHMPLAPGTTAAPVPRPTPPDRYCFIVTVVISASEIRRSPPECTV